MHRWGYPRASKGLSDSIRGQVLPFFLPLAMLPQLACLVNKRYLYSLAETPAASCVIIPVAENLARCCGLGL